jgi:hypothetical protein
MNQVQQTVKDLTTLADESREQMRALSLTRPWAWAILHGGKRVENRSWKPPSWVIGKIIALHAAKSYDPTAIYGIHHAMGFEPLAKACPVGEENHPHSAIVGLARVTGFVDESNYQELPITQQAWFFGCYGWLLEDVQALASPVPCKGALSLWKLPEEVERQVLM